MKLSFISVKLSGITTCNMNDNHTRKLNVVLSNSICNKKNVGRIVKKMSEMCSLESTIGLR